MSTRHLDIDKAGPTVADVMMPQPHTNSVDESIAAAREKLAKSSVKLLVVVDGERFSGTIGRNDLPAEDGDGTLGTIARSDGPQLRPGDPVEAALQLHRDGAERIPVVEDGVLRGLVCLNSGADYFCA